MLANSDMPKGNCKPLPLSETMKVLELITKGKKHMLRLLRSTIRASLLSMRLWKTKKKFARLHHRNGGMRSASWNPGSYNKLNSYILTKDNLSNTQAHLRDPHIKLSEGGQIRWAGEEGKGNCRDAGHRRQSRAHCSLRRGKNSGCRHTPSCP